MIDVLNDLIRHEDQYDHARALAQLVGELGGQADTPLGGDSAIVARYERALTRDLPPTVLDALRRNLEAKRR
ncbi:MAG: hypothetical protein JO257_31880 [Deltaproteobacteria bacterium]|nr:hypothetical protein [Deltaproteobacteria bacterium]